MYNRRATLAYILYNPHTAGRGLRIARGVDSALCQIPSSVNSKRSVEARSLDKRVIWVYEDEWHFGIPSLTSVLRGIRLGPLTLHYARWEWISGGKPMLELAYWIGREPGVEDDNPDLDDYRDTRDQTRQSDRWIVIHLHVDPRTNWLQRLDGQTYMGITGMSVFHGQEAVVEERTWRADGRGTTATARNGWYCRQAEGSLWFVGAPIPNMPPPGDDDDSGSEGDQSDPERFYRSIQSFGASLYTQGYVAAPGLRLILEGGGSLNGDIDPENPGRLLTGRQTSSALRGLIPYGVNWLIDRFRGYDLFIPPPPE
ncbi:hypothetical protein ACHAP7_012162 [Fusarium lateritium]